MNVPSWATYTEREGKIPLVDVDTDKAYPAMLAELATLKPQDFPELDARFQPTGEMVALQCGTDRPDVYWLEVAYQCIKLDLQRLLGMAIEIHFRDATKKWSHKHFEDGRGWFPATKMKEAREHYRRLRGRLP